MTQENSKRIVKLIGEKEYGKCKICGTAKVQALYVYRNYQYISDYVPPILKPVCRKCVYKEVYGSKKFNKKMKERTLDGEL
tara:strand:+ start:671 stop:913 length:243 start_codon:yes stop_codon:yes gene_type:complete